MAVQLELLALLALSTGDPAAAAGDPAQAPTTAVLNQHVAVSMLSAMYYCESVIERRHGEIP